MRAGSFRHARLVRLPVRALVTRRALGALLLVAALLGRLPLMGGRLGIVVHGSPYRYGQWPFWTVGRTARAARPKSCAPPGASNAPRAASSPGATRSRPCRRS